MPTTPCEQYPDTEQPTKTTILAANRTRRNFARLACLATSFAHARRPVDALVSLAAVSLYEAKPFGAKGGDGRGKERNEREGQLAGRVKKPSAASDVASRVGGGVGSCR
ncbi:Hypothetical predicted protein [Podarcis lilfordi]|uniref:Uncharacterized protein n=1 Tax=Podarcis lilfordi TaxID=74358 RepID=A0AA35K1N8_9SAUR|nr:Hypothetical predicted protein [Podarcis lilfordi]